ncbi:protocadherin beta-1-like [Ctenopharyngodon idella]|uniref:protocadherin beta-1-like n=1 Tax=Ctenopharyngodon idella TaxID=7959 RepID=UPI002231574B|nr:protocadherin beta-1-like [Ctenopharyngodon idella]
MALFSVLIILACLHVHSVRSAIGSSEINCASSSNRVVGRVEEGYEGDVEIITIGPNDRLVLEPHMTGIVLSLLELVYTEGDTTAIVRTIRPLDAEEIRMYGESLSYFVSCFRGPKHARQLYVLDVNDNPPIFQSKSYSATVSEAMAVGSNVLTVTAIDADATTENKRITYSILPPVPDAFEVVYDRNNGNIRLTKPLNYNDVQQYIFTVEAKDIGELRDTTTVTITVEKQNTEEYQEEDFSDITPEDIKDQDGNMGINKPVNSPVFT